MADNVPFGTPFLTPKIPPKKFLWVTFLRSFPGNEAHKLFSGGPKWGVLGGGQKVYVERVYMLFPPLSHFEVISLTDADVYPPSGSAPPKNLPTRNSSELITERYRYRYRYEMVWELIR